MFQVFKLINQHTGSFSDWKELGYLALLNYSYDDNILVDFRTDTMGLQDLLEITDLDEFWSARTCLEH